MREPDAQAGRIAVEVRHHEESSPSGRPQGRRRHPRDSRPPDAISGVTHEHARLARDHTPARPEAARLETAWPFAGTLRGGTDPLEIRHHRNWLERTHCDRSSPDALEYR